MNVTYVPCPDDKVAIKCPFPMTPTRVVVHNTSNDASAYNEIRYMHRNGAQVSFHYAVDDVGAVQGIDLGRNAWHAGDGGSGVGNRQGIAVEICYSKSGGKRFRRSVCNGAALVHRLITERGWGLDRVTAHRDYSGKHCPHRILDEYGFSAFRSLVAAQGITDGVSAARRLGELGVIDAEYWIGRLGRIRYLDTLLIRASHAIIAAGATLPDTESAFTALGEAGVVNTPAYWRKNMGKDKYLPLLLRKLGGAV
ncbi:MAG: N-acetylmuramoyl-L-alanine amidase [Clostridia bacterium]|nr:N-acetylmuramoyl-L-alanine amidase [Clostridia bacterium]